MIFECALPLSIVISRALFAKVPGEINANFLENTEVGIMDSVLVLSSVSY